MQILEGFGGPQNPSKILPCRGDLLLDAVGAHVNFGAVVGWGPGGAQGETEVR